MDLWGIGLALLVIGIAVPSSIAIYYFILAEISWYWKVSTILIALSCIALVTAAGREKMESEPPEEKY